MHLQVTGFHELETREVFYIGAILAPIPDELDDALSVLETATNYAVDSGKADEWCNRFEADGILIDLCDGATVMASYEHVPGRRLTFWFGDECHE